VPLADQADVLARTARGNYPLSIALNVHALNITMVSNADTSTSGWVVAGKFAPSAAARSPWKTSLKGSGARGRSVTTCPAQRGLLLSGYRRGRRSLIAHPGGRLLGSHRTTAPVDSEGRVRARRRPLGGRAAEFA